MIIDGKAAFTGGVNLADEYINLTHPHGHWKDCAVLVRGEAVWSMTAMFLAFWGYVDRSAEDLSVFRPQDAAVPSDGFCSRLPTARSTMKTSAQACTRASFALHGAMSG